MVFHFLDRLALDLYTQKFREIDLPFTNPFQQTTMLGYNPHTKVRTMAQSKGTQEIFLFGVTKEHSRNIKYKERLNICFLAMRRDRIQK